VRLERGCVNVMQNQLMNTRTNTQGNHFSEKTQFT
jgi:hypothetical protein